ncbi:hypothetical protein [Miltoncostaea oceani]|jgi:hypothetical protein|uniref:hypothetical protein n=1 Tax=Miltoncostaea oceani TaxID=2843216 RepID=UPI001C3DAEE3|nr:hypothetical protein [Miltoncostaea oceani]
MGSRRAADPDPTREFRSRIDAARTITALRARLLGGRGPGADDDEVARHTRRRSSLAGRPVVEHLEEVAARTATLRSAD